MKILLLFISTLIIPLFSWANEIDNLNTDKEINDFLLHKVFKDTWKGEPFWKNRKVDSLQYGKDKFVKIDINADGRTDLLVNGSNLFIILDRGKGHYKISFVDRGDFHSHTFTLLNIIYTGKIPMLVVAPVDEFKGTLYPDRKPDTLIFKFGGMVEYNPSPDILAIKEFKMSHFGWLNEAYFIIDSSRNAYFYSSGNKKKHSVDKDGKPVYKIKNLRVRMSRDDIQYLNTNLSYINILSHQDMDSNGAIDAALDVLEIKFTSGKVLTIQDRSRTASAGLYNLYQQVWRTVNKMRWRRNFRSAPIENI